jgi:hypothetical protein
MRERVSDHTVRLVRHNTGQWGPGPRQSAVDVHTRHAAPEYHTTGTSTNQAYPCSYSCRGSIRLVQLGTRRHRDWWRGRCDIKCLNLHRGLRALRAQRALLCCRDGRGGCADLQNL